MLVLDEPTNDLDIDTLELLEDLLQNYDGTVFLVSHDRSFMDNVVTSTIAFEGDGRWREYEGSVEDWLIQSRRASEIKGQKGSKPSQSLRNQLLKNEQIAAPTPPLAPAAPALKTRKLSFKEQRELDGLPDQIAALEAEQKIARQPSFIAAPAIRAGLLDVLLVDFPGPELGIHAVFPSNRYLPTRVRALADYLAERIGPSPYWDAGLP